VLQNGGDSTTRARPKVIVAFCPQLETSRQSFTSTRHTINRIAERILSRRRGPTIRSRQRRSQGQIYQSLSPLVHYEDRIPFSLYVRRSDFGRAVFLSMSAVI
jgi:hypothetical protein